MECQNAIDLDSFPLTETCGITESAATSTWRFNLMVLRILDETLTVKIFRITQRVYNGNVTLTLFVKGLILQSSTIKITSGGP